MLQGKSALVTGSTSGIGLAIARALAAHGANVTINGFGDKVAIEKERASIEEDYKVKAIYSPADMSKAGQIADKVRNSEKSFGSLDVLVNNAGVQFVSPIEEFPVEKWDQIIAINLSSAFHTIRTAVPVCNHANGAALLTPRPRIRWSRHRSRSLMSRPSTALWGSPRQWHSSLRPSASHAIASVLATSGRHLLRGRYQTPPRPAA